MEGTAIINPAPLEVLGRVRVVEGEEERIDEKVHTDNSLFHGVIGDRYVAT